MTADENPTTATAEANAQASASVSEPPEAPGPDEAAVARAELAEVKSRLLHTLADMENLRRRTRREVDDARQYAIANFARDMLTVSDNLRRALEAVPEELRADGNPALTALIEGVEVTERGLQQALSKIGVQPIDAKGQKFDPSMHQAIFEIDADDLPPGAVAQEIQAGYVIGERVLRPAMVAVAKRPPPPAPEPPQDGGAATNDDGAGEPPAQEQAPSDDQG